MAMAHLPIIRSFLSSHSSHENQTNTQNYEDIVKKGYLAKRKNMKNRYFVLRWETSDDSPARLEYYDSEKKFLDGSQPKKKYILKDCFNISQKTDRNHFVIALYINTDCIGLVTKTESEMREWLQLLQYHKNFGAEPRIEYEHVWQVEVLPRSLASTWNLTGHHWLCLTNRLLSLVRADIPNVKQEFELSTIKKCGFLDQFFYFILSRHSCIGCGELYMQTDDSYIAQSIHNSVGSAMNNFERSSSMTESSIRKRTISDPQSDVRLPWRRDSVPTICRSNPPGVSRFGFHPSFEGTHHLHDCEDVRRVFSTSFGTCSEEDRRRPLTPDKEFLDFDEEFPTDVPDCREAKTEIIPPINARTARRVFPGDVPSTAWCGTSPGREAWIDTNSVACEENVYVWMGNGDRPPPPSLGLSPRVIPTSFSGGLVSPGSAPLGVSTPLNTPLGGCSFPGTCLPSPQTSTGSQSRNPSTLEDAYVPILSPGAQGSSQGPSGSSSPYLEMVHSPSVVPGNERRRTISTPTPIPVSPSDEDSCGEMYGNSGSSSCTSGTPSDQRIHDIGGDERGATPLSGLWGSLTPNYMGPDETDLLGCPRPIRTNSVGSKPEQFKKKNRLDAAVPLAEPARVRAFSVGSRVSLKFGVGRHGASGPHVGSEHSSVGLGEMFPSIKESGKQAKSKSTSAPMLGGSPISNSWSGTPGSYFRGFIQSRNPPREKNLMELDFSKNKSCDFIPTDDKDKERDRKMSRERLWHTLTGQRHRSNSKSSGSSTSKLCSDSWSKEKRMSEGDGSNRGVEIPFAGDRNDYSEINFKPSPRSSASDPTKGYLPMIPPPYISSSLTTAGEHLEKRGPRTTSLGDSSLEKATSLSSCDSSQDEYVIMTLGSSSGLTIASSSSSSNSINGPVTCAKTRRSSNIHNPLCNSIYNPITTSQELPSPMEDILMDEETMGAVVEGFGSTEGRKKGKKGSKRKSLRDSAKRKKSESSMVGGESPEFPHKFKTPGPLATLTNFISRKPSNNLKAPLSPKGSPLPPKGGKESSSPFSSLTRNKNKDKDFVRTIGEDAECYCHSGETNNPSFTPSPPSTSPQGSSRRMSGGPVETPSPPPPQISVQKSDDKMLFSPLDASKLRRQSSKTEVAENDNRHSAYMNLQVASKESAIASLPSLNVIQISAAAKPVTYLDTRNYMNMQPGTSSPQLSPREIDSSSPRPSLQVQLPMATQPVEENYMIMGARPAAPSVPSEVAKRPVIPSKLLSNHSQSPSLALEKLSLREEKPGSISSERSRSHSGPGAPEATKGGARKADDGRAASACSSPVSYSPPTSPTLGSVSSMSSLSEGGLSSASSTCTVINVGVKNPVAGAGASSATPVALKVTPPPQLSQPPTEPPAPSSSDTKEEEAQPPTPTPPPPPPPPAVAAAPSSDNKPAEEKEILNYVALDLGNKNCKTTSSSSCSSSPKLVPKNGPQKLPLVVCCDDDDEDTPPSSYVEIDFKKSEGLRNTTIARDSARPH